MHSCRFRSSSEGAAGSRATCGARPSSTRSEPRLASDNSDPPGSSGLSSGHTSVLSTLYSSRLYNLDFTIADVSGLT
eukprot:108453-Alexandrium_andersonii.AAC.1